MREQRPELQAFLIACLKDVIHGADECLPSEKGTKPARLSMSSGSEYHLSGMKSSGRTKHSLAELTLATNRQQTLVTVLTSSQCIYRHIKIDSSWYENPIYQDTLRWCGAEATGRRWRMQSQSLVDNAV